MLPLGRKLFWVQFLYKRVNANQIAEGGYNVTGCISQSIPTLLAIEDTTTLSYTHQVKESLGDLGGPIERSSRGFHVHTTMLMDADKAPQSKTVYRKRGLQMG